MVIFDTNILIEIYRGNESVRNTIYSLNFSEIYISDITAAELPQPLYITKFLYTHSTKRILCISQICNLLQLKTYS